MLLSLWILGWPTAWFDLAGLAPPIYLFPWQAVGILAGIYGLGLILASLSPIKHWPIVFVGFLAKILIPLGFVVLATASVVPWRAGWLLLFSDLVWLAPFAMVLWAAACAKVGRPAVGEPMRLEEAMNSFHLSGGETLGEASQKQTLAIVFLRHFGCTFTRQLLRNLEDMHERARERGARLVMVHMLQEGEELEFLDHAGVERIADPRCDLYRAFGLGKGGFLELFGPKVIYRGAIAFFRGCGAGLLKGDGLQMPGAFLVENGKVLKARKAKSAADLPDVEALFEV